MMIHKHLGGFRQGNFLKPRIDFTPEGSAPGCIQFLNIVMVFLFQEFPESFFCCLIIVKLYSRLIIQLPTNYARILSIMAGQFFNHTISEFPVNRRSKRSMLACPMILHSTVFGLQQNLRIFTA